LDQTGSGQKNTQKDNSKHGGKKGPEDCESAENAEKYSQTPDPSVWILKFIVVTIVKKTYVASNSCKMIKWSKATFLI
jgi:hypothetical protein